MSCICFSLLTAPTLPCFLTTYKAVPPAHLLLAANNVPPAIAGFIVFFSELGQCQLKPVRHLRTSDCMESMLGLVF